jgi:hypothetical protein
MPRAWLAWMAARRWRADVDHALDRLERDVTARGAELEQAVADHRAFLVWLTRETGLHPFPPGTDYSTVYTGWLMSRAREAGEHW